MGTSVLMKRGPIRNIKAGKERLIEKYGNVCGYCGIVLDNKIMEVDHFYPRNRYPEKDSESNWVLCCPNCNRRKAAKSPMDENGKEMIIFPYDRRYKEEIVVSDDGVVRGLTDAAKSTIDIFDLNRPDLVAYRNSNVAQNFIFDKNRLPKDIYEESIELVEELLSKIGLESETELESYLYKIIYANVIASLEAYLSKIYMIAVMNETVMWKFVENYFTDKKIKLSDIKKHYDEIPSQVQLEVSQFLFHNISKTIDLFKKTLDIDIFDSEAGKKKMMKAVKIRHDIVHRNGRKENENGNSLDLYHTISMNEVREVIAETNKMVDKIETGLKSIDFWNINE